MIDDRYEEYEAIIKALPDIVFVLTESGKYAAVLGGHSSEYYHDGGSLKDLNLFDVLSNEKATWFIEKIRETILANKVMVFDYSLTADDVDSIDPSSGPSGELRFEGRVTPLKSQRYGERAVVWVARNITERYQLEQQLIYHSEIDYLSNIYNRRKLFECLDNAYYNFQRYGENISFLLLDIDSFKQINDKFGHLVGDRLIRLVAELCQSELRETDVLGRFGGDEFGIICRRGSEASLALAKRLNKLISETDFDTNITVSIGISVFLESDNGVEQIYQRADRALYQSKHDGKNQTMVYQL